MQLGEVRREGHVVELAAVEPGVEPPERAGVGAARVRADGGLDQPARGLSRSTDRGLCGLGPGGRSIHVKGNARPIIRARAGTCWSDTAGGRRILDPADGAVRTLTTGYDNFPAWSRRAISNEATERFMDQVIRNLSPEFEDFSEFGRSTRHAKYLFENDVNTYLDELRKRAALLRKWSTEYDRHVEGKPVPHSPNEVVEGKNREVQWFAEQWGERRGRQEVCCVPGRVTDRAWMT